MLDRKASFAIEALAALLVLSLCSLLTVSAARLFRMDTPDYARIESGIMQLQLLIALSEIIEVDEHEVHLLYQNEEAILKEVNEALIRTPGTVAYLHPVTDVRFWMEDELLRMSFCYQSKEMVFTLGKKEWWRD